MPSSLKRAAKRLIPYYRKVRCPICDTWDHQFPSFGLVPRPNALCPGCGSLERHRMVWDFLRRETDLFDHRPKKMLHVAAEPALSSRLRHVPNLDYLTADLLDPSAMVVMDITNIPYPDQSFDVIYCSHVLEHVPDDRKALREFRRVLKSSGWTVVVVPIEGATTFEDPTVTDPKERERLFGQADHVRLYGPDFEERLVQAGFRVQAIRTTDLYSAEEMARHAVRADEHPIFFCTPAA
jgi:SAM-dependent methyltransferase